jgi:hypothetical protein
LQDKILRVHPLGSDMRDTGYKAQLEAAYKKAKEQAGFASSYTRYLYALKTYLYALNDEAIQLLPKQPPEFIDWTGFLLDYQNGKAVVRAVDPATPGAETRVIDGWPLLNCETIAFDDYAKQRLEGLETGVLDNEAKLIRNTAKIFLDYRNPLNNRAGVCEFTTSDGKRRVRLTWRPMLPEVQARLKADLAAVNRMPPDPAPRMRILANGAAWISLPTLDGTSASADLLQLLADMKQESRTLRRAPFVVVDVRGNTGGQAPWGRALAETIWPKAAVDSVAPPALRYRVTQDAIEAATKASKEFGPRLSPFYQELAQKLSTAQQKGDAFLETVPVAKSAPTSKPARRAPLVYLLTDAGCTNACLDLRNLFKGLGAKLVGETTSPDTPYFNTLLRFDLPSGMGQVALPMAVKTTAPAPTPPALDAVWKGRMDDDAGLVPWIISLAETARALKR